MRARSSRREPFSELRLTHFADFAQVDSRPDRSQQLLPDLIVPRRRMMRPKAERHGIDLSLELAPSLPDVERRPAQIARVPLNLIDNAIRHTRPVDR